MKIELPPDGSSRERVETASRWLFGNKYELAAIVFIAQQDVFFQGELAEGARCRPNQAGEIIKRLVEAPVIARVPTEPGQRRQYFRKLPCPLWRACVDWMRELLDEPGEGVTRLPRSR